MHSIISELPTAEQSVRSKIIKFERERKGKGGVDREDVGIGGGAEIDRSGILPFRQNGMPKLLLNSKALILSRGLTVLLFATC